MTAEPSLCEQVFDRNWPGFAGFEACSSGQLVVSGSLQIGTCWSGKWLSSQISGIIGFRIPWHNFVANKSFFGLKKLLSESFVRSFSWLFWFSKTEVLHDWQPISNFWSPVSNVIGIKNPNWISWADGSCLKLLFRIDLFRWSKNHFLLVFCILTFLGVSSPDFSPHCLCSDWRHVFRSQELIEKYPVLLALLATCFFRCEFSSIVLLSRNFCAAQLRLCVQIYGFSNSFFRFTLVCLLERFYCHEFNDLVFAALDTQDQTEPEEKHVLGCMNPLKAYYRFIVLSFTCIMSFGNYFCFDMPSVLQNEFQSPRKCPENATDCTEGKL